MKVNILDAHDRLEHFKRQNFNIADCCQDLIDQRPFGDYPFYIFAHARTDDDGVTKRLIWQPRLTKPKAQSNSMLFKGYPGSDNVKVIWIIPAEELWGQYEHGLLLQNQTVVESIAKFKNNPKTLEAREPDDLSDEKIDQIYREMSQRATKQEIINGQEFLK